MLSQTAEYALRAVLYIAQHGDRLVQVGEMAQALRIPRNYLSKIVHVLARDGVLESTRGKAGGFRLAKAPDRLHVVQVVSPFDRLDEVRHCLLGRPQCSDRTACAAHTRWKEVAERVAEFFRETTVAELLLGSAVPV
ncbi:MAG TPA: Rrf2 family transcriptional regulator [Gemmatimonadales bacterium]|nr:Rrf2 family transcriptional regulator [Gemmatimonadales bacterium]